MNTKVKLTTLTLDNPIIPASGTFGYGYEMSRFYDINILGSFSIKGTTKDPRFGNPTPRIAEAPSGMINSVGLQNPGVDAVIKEEFPKLSAVYSKKVLANVSGFSIEEYKECAAKLDVCDIVGIIELNVSCPNVHGGGQSFGISAELAASVTREIKRVTSKPVYIKLTPNVTDIVSIAKACEEAGADGLCLINTVMGMRIDMNKRVPILANTKGGLSGPAIFPIALRAIFDVYKQVKIPIIGMGGVSCAKDTIEMMMAGASAVQVGAANLVNPYVCKEIIEDLPNQMQKYKIENLQDIIGAAHNNV